MKPTLFSILLALVACTSVYAFPATENRSVCQPPFYFIDNEGQITDQDGHSRSDIDFRLSAANGLTVFIGKGVIHYQFCNAVGAKAPDRVRTRGQQPDKLPACTMYRMDVTLAGANANATVVRDQPLSYRETYYTPGTGDNGVSVGACDRVTYRNIYPNIDWVLYVKDGHLKYEFMVRKGGDPSMIQLKYEGATGLEIGSDGSLRAATPMGTITEEAPYTYQEDGTAIKSGFRLNGNTLSFAVAKYSGNLVIDPGVAWATYYGGNFPDYATCVTTDSTGFVYMSGNTNSASGIATTGAFLTVYTGTTDIFIVKFTPNGSRIWATYYGGTGVDEQNAIVAEAHGDIYIVGETYSTAGITTPGSFQATYGGGGFDGYLTKFDSAGARLWGTYFGTTGYDIARNVTLDNAGNVFITGFTNSTTGIATPGAYQTAFAGGTFNGDIFLAKFTPMGTRLWGTYYGSSNDDFGDAITTDASGNIYVAGNSASYGLASPGSWQTTNGGGSEDAILVKFNSLGMRVWATYYGGNDRDAFACIFADAYGNVYGTGSSNSTAAIASAGAHQPVKSGFMDAIIVKFNAAGMRVWGTYYGGNLSDGGNGVGINDSGDLYVSGSTASSTGMATAGAMQPFFGGDNDGFIVKLDTAGDVYWGTYYGFSDLDDARGMVLKGYGIYLTGYTESAGLATPGSHQSAHAGGTYDAFLTKIYDCPTFMLTSPLSPPAICDSTLFSYVPTSATPGIIFSWSRALVPGVTALPAAGTGNPNEFLNSTATDPVTVIYLYTISTGGCSSVDTVKVVVNPTPWLSNPLPPPPVCTSTPFNFVPASATTGTTYAWSRAVVGGIVNPAASGITGISETLVNATTVPISVTYTYTLTANGCSHSQTVTVVVNPVADAGAISGPDTVCQGMTITLTDPAPGGTWSSSTGNTSVAGGVVTGINAGTDIVSYTVALCGPIAATKSLVILPTSDCSTAIGSQPSPGKGLILYPNPSDGSFTVNVLSAKQETVNWMITNVTGQKVYDCATTTNHASTLKLNVPRGLYIIYATTSERTYTSKLMIR